MFSTPQNATLRDLRWFGGLGLLFAWGAAAWLSRTSGFNIWAIGLVIVGLLSGIAALTHPGWLRPIYVGWMRIVSPIGWLVGHVLLGIVYFGVLMPVGWGLRLFGHDPLQRQVDLNATTYWRPRSRQRTPSDYFRQF